MRKKLKTCRGTSIAEMMIAIVLLALLTAGGITAASAVMASYNHMKEAANADILASTVIEAFSNEIRLGRGIKIDPATGSDTLTLDSAFFGEGAQLRIQDDQLVAIPGTPTGTGTPKSLLSEDTYSGLHLAKRPSTAIFAKADPAGTAGRAVYTISFAICNASGNVLWSGTASAAPLR